VKFYLDEDGRTGAGQADGISSPEERQEPLQASGLDPGTQHRETSRLTVRAIHEDAVQPVVPDGGGESIQRGRHLRYDSAGRFRLDEDQPLVTGRHHEVDLETLLVPEIVELAL